MHVLILLGGKKVNSSLLFAVIYKLITADAHICFSKDVTGVKWCHRSLLIKMTWCRISSLTQSQAVGNNKLHVLLRGVGIERWRVDNMLLNLKTSTSICLRPRGHSLQNHCSAAAADCLNLMKQMNPCYPQHCSALLPQNRHFFLIHLKPCPNVRSSNTSVSFPIDVIWRPLWFRNSYWWYSILKYKLIHYPVVFE